jgi:segregation and condensation protein B
MPKPLRHPESSLAAVLEHARMVEALLFASAEPLDEADLREHLPEGVDLKAVLSHLFDHYDKRGVRLVRTGSRWGFRTAPDLAPILRRDAVEPRKLSRAAIETLAIVAYHQPVTRAEIEAIRGVSVAKGTLDVLIETGWVRLRGRRRSPGRPVTFGTTAGFLDHFGLEQISDLPGLDDLKGAGLFDGRLPPSFDMPFPSDDSALRDDEDPIEGDMLDFFPPAVKNDEEPEAP